MHPLQYSLRALVMVTVFVALIAGLFLQARVNSGLNNENQSLRRELGLPSQVHRGKLYVLRAHAPRIKDQHHWVWRAIVPEGSNYWIRVCTVGIPLSDAVPREGRVAFELTPGETVLHGIATRSGASWELRLSAEEDKGTAVFAFDGGFLQNGGVFFQVPLAEDGVRPPQEVVLYKAYQAAESNRATTEADSGLMIWIERTAGGPGGGGTPELER